MVACNEVTTQTTQLHKLRAQARKAAKRVLEAALNTDPQELHDACVSAVAVLGLVAVETEEAA